MLNCRSFQLSLRELMLGCLLASMILAWWRERAVVLEYQSKQQALDEYYRRQLVSVNGELFAYKEYVSRVLEKRRNADFRMQKKDP
jgi:hypothetical protein